MRARILSITALSLLFAGFPVAIAHHSFAVYDFNTQIEFVGEVATLNFKNPHISMTMNVVQENGESTVINFIEGAPANMLARKGLRPDMIAAGTTITAFGSPLIADPTKFFLRRVRLSDGRVFE
jgi:hypothetical protein